MAVIAFVSRELLTGVSRSCVAYDTQNRAHSQQGVFDTSTLLEKPCLRGIDRGRPSSESKRHGNNTLTALGRLCP